MAQSAEPRRNLHTHTHTHTHTDKLLPSLKQIGTICFTISLFTFPNFTFATNIPTTNPGCTTSVLGADNVANRSAALEPDFSANTINTTWYSNGTQLTGDNIPATCTYDAALTPPTPAARPGYTFGGWTLRVPETVNCSGIEDEGEDECVSTDGCVKITSSSCRTVVSSCAGVDNQESCENSGTRGEMFCICGWNGSACVSVGCEPGF